MSVHAAVDLGASGGRVMAGIVDDDGIRLEPVYRFPNSCAERDGHLRWDADRLFGEVDTGLAQVPEAQTIGIDTWGVDYGLLDEDGVLLAEPVAHRDERTDAVVDQVHDLVPPDELYRVNGLQHLPFTTLYQLAADDLLDRAAHVVLIPDLLAHRLTGELATEVTNASTTGLLEVRTRQWSTDLFQRLGLPNRFPPLQDPGERRSGKVITVGSHDTASAVVGVPATSDRFAYVCCGTWSLVGLELSAPVVTDASRRANFTNEAGVDGRTRFLRNVGGLWLLQECLREWGRDDLTELLDQAAERPRGAVIDVDDPAFIPPGRMPERIAEAAGRPLDVVDTARCIIDSLAEAFARTIHQATDLAGTSVDVVHVVGGGSQNELLCRLTAEAVGLPVLAGPVEATALGNVLVQARTPGESLESLRARLVSSTQLRRYEP